MFIRRKRVNAMIDAEHNLRGQVDVQRVKLDAEKARAADLNARLEESQGEVGDLQKEVRDLNKSLRDYIANAPKAVTLMKPCNLAHLEPGAAEALTKAENALRVTSKALDESENDNGELRAKFKTAEGDNGHLIAELGRERVRVDHWEKCAESRRVELEKVSAKLKASEAYVAERRSRVTELEDYNSRLAAQVAELTTKNAELANKVACAAAVPPLDTINALGNEKALRQRATDALDMAEKEIIRLTDELGQSRKNAHRLSAMNTANARKLELNEMTIDSMKGHRDRAANVHERRRQYLADAESKNAALTGKLETREAELATYKEAHETLTHRLTRSRARHAKASQHVLAGIKAREATFELIDTLKADLAGAKATVAQQAHNLAVRAGSAEDPLAARVFGGLHTPGNVAIYSDPATQTTYIRMSYGFIRRNPKAVSGLQAAIIELTNEADS